MYQVILADPPWRYNSLAHHKSKFRGGPVGHYDLMKLADIKAMPVSQLADPDRSVLFLWATQPMMREALEVIEAWGFTYKTAAFMWIKLNKKDLKPKWGVGHYTAANAESCLIATRGKPPKPARHFLSVVQEVPGRHSEKPYKVKDMICLMYPEAKRLELFSREIDPRFDVWGNDLPLEHQTNLFEGTPYDLHA